MIFREKRSRGFWQETLVPVWLRLLLVMWPWTDHYTFPVKWGCQYCGIFVAWDYWEDEGK